VRQVGYLQRLYRDARSTEHKTNHILQMYYYILLFTKYPRMIFRFMVPYIVVIT